ncbi:uncharacterized protein [Dermacentor andersoni]|uniref:uncharacterized protein n=1 Tax=Dermacentor andersoni TaxID=34620 RepID=UPI002155E0E9|nr:uncharacterized protein LOC126543582 [Dermacentor andersoni]XP_050046650.1 uncharacterized protein LOC126543584 [Dermacentor andersoni]
MIPCSSILPAPPRTSEPRQTASSMLPRCQASDVWADSPELWFAQVEAQFALAHITQDRTRYNCVVAHLDARYANEVRGILAKPPTANIYEHLKTELIRRLPLSENQKVQQLQSAELAERNPLQLIHHMRALAGNVEVQDSFL